MIALILIGAIAISIGALVISGHFGLPYLAMISPDPTVSGYIGYYAGLIALGIIPMILLIKTAINFIGGYKSSIRFKRAISGVWIVSFVLFILTGIFTARNFVHEAQLSEIVLENDLDQDQPFNIKVVPLDRRNNLRIQFSESAFLSDGNFYNGDGVDVYFRPAENDKLKVTRTGSSRGMNYRSAVRNMHYPNHNLELSENSITLDEYYTLGRRDKFRAQKLRYDIAIPVGTIVSLERSSPIFRNREFRSKKGEGEKWIMTTDGFQIESDS